LNLHRKFTLAAILVPALAFSSAARILGDGDDAPKNDASKKDAPKNDAPKSDSAKPADSGAAADHELIQRLVEQNRELLDEVRALQQRVAGIENKSDAATTVAATSIAPPAATTISAPVAISASTPPVPPPAGAPPASNAAADSNVSPAAADPQSDHGGHNMDIPGGPKVNIRGFLDFNFGVGPDANALIYPLSPVPSNIHNSFQFGEFDLFLSSRLSQNVSFLSEIVFGSDQTNNWGIDIERAQISYKPSQYFQLSGGRMHTYIGYYNTAFHHGTWFQTATGRPFMYFFEDSGGILPVHIVGVSAQGLVPDTGKWNLHWIAEVGNGDSDTFLSDSSVNPVQNFYADKNHKAFNVAGYIKPDWLPGLQIGGNYYYDVRVPLDLPHVDNTIAGFYAVYITPKWEFLNEIVDQRDKSVGTTIAYNTPLGYTQISRKFGKFRPYFRWQEVNVPVNDPLYGTVGRYEGPSPGLRMDFATYAALKLQYNRLYTRSSPPQNGLDGQVAFTF
jgi:hypothetical protein